MSRVSDLRLDIQSSNEYREGWRAFQEGKTSAPPFTYRFQKNDKAKHWLMGWDDARIEEQSP